VFGLVHGSHGPCMMKFADQVPNIYTASRRSHLSWAVLISGSTGSSSHHQHSCRDPAQKRPMRPQQPNCSKYDCHRDAVAPACWRWRTGRQPEHVDPACCHRGFAAGVPQRVVAPSTKASAGRAVWRCAPSHACPPVSLWRGTRPSGGSAAGPSGRTRIGPMVARKRALAVMIDTGDLRGVVSS